MLAVARKPIVQYVAEELVANGVEQILFVTGRNKSSIENHFDSDPELTRILKAGNKNDILSELEGFEDLEAKFFYTRQRHQRGLGDAVLCGENFAGEQPVVIALGDSIIGVNAQSKAVSQMVALFEEKRASCVVAVEEVPKEEVMNYGVVDIVTNGDNTHRITRIVEKPSPETAPSNLAVAARYVFSPLIFDMIRRVKPDKRNEIQLTDAIQMLCEEGKRVLAFKLAEADRRFDIGNFPSYFETFVEFALADPIYGADFRVSLERLLKKK
jgi:UTP--glucose-1-phosphate uridylyltransferase